MVNEMKNETLQIIGRECKVFELQLPCECGGYYVANINFGDIESRKYIDGKLHVQHVCTECNKQIYIEDIYPKHSFRPYGEFIRFGELSGVSGSPSDEDNKQE